MEKVYIVVDGVSMEGEHIRGVHRIEAMAIGEAQDVAEEEACTERLIGENKWVANDGFRYVEVQEHRVKP